MSSETEQREGGCACGALRYRVTGALATAVACHCGQCRKAHSSFGIYTRVDRAALSIDNENELTWYESSPGVRRGFCRRCGAALFWDRLSTDSVSVATGSFDQPSGLRLVRHIFVADKADFYDIADGLEQLPQGHGGPVPPGDAS